MRTYYSIRLLAAFVFILTGMNAHSQKSGDYRSVVSGNWNETATWQVFTDSGWQALISDSLIPSQKNGLIQIQPNTVVVISDSISTDRLQIDIDGKLIIADSGFLLLKTSSSNVAIAGTLENSGYIQQVGTFTLKSLGVYKHKSQQPFSSAGFTWQIQSTIEFSGGNKVEWLVSEKEISLCRLVISNSTTLSIGSKDGDLKKIKTCADSSLKLSSGSSLVIQPGIQTFVINKSSVVQIDGILVNNSNIEISGENAKVFVAGKLSNAGIVSSNNASNLFFKSASVYEHLQDGGVVPLANWSKESRCLFNSIKSKMPEGLNQALGHVSFESSLASNLFLKGSLDCAGDLVFANSPGYSIALSHDSTHSSVLVGGNFILKSGEVIVGNSKGKGSLQVTGNFSQLGGILTLKTSVGDAEIYVMNNLFKQDGDLQFNTKDTLTAKGTAEITVVNNFEHTGGTTNFSLNSAEGTLNVAGNVFITGGILTESGLGKGVIRFNGRSPQTYNDGGSFHQVVDFVVDSLAFLQMASSSTRISGNGRFVLMPGSSFGIKNGAGLVNFPSSGGHINTPVRIYNSGIHLIYNGTNNQSIGDAFENKIVPASITIDNPTIVAQSSDVIIGGDFKIIRGEFQSRNHNLIVTGNWMNNGIYDPAYVSSVTFKGFVNQKIAGSNHTTFSQLLIDNSSGVKLENNISVTTQLELINGILEVGQHMLTLSAKSLPILADSLNENKMIALSKDGSVRKEAFSILQANYNFPVGNIEGSNRLFSPINLTFKNGSFKGFLSVSVTNQKHPNNPDTENYLKRFWTIEQEGFKGFTATVSAIFDSSDVVGNPMDLRLGKFSHDSLNSNWVSFPTPPEKNVFYATDITSFSDFTGLSKKEIDKAAAARKMNTVAVTNPNDLVGPALVKIFPNPVTKNELQLTLNNFQTGKYEIQIVNSLGQKIHQQSLQHPGGLLNLKINLGSNQPNGIYHLQLFGTGENYLTTFIKN